METNAMMESSAAPISNLSLAGVLGIPAVRQIMLLIGVAASVAAGLAVVLWSQTPSYTKLYSDLDTADAAQVVEALRGAGIQYDLDTGSGIVLVEASRLHEARLELATQGLPQGGGSGMDMLQDQSSFGVSQFMETARFQHALETELARTISHIGSVRNARVHLATPKQSAFIRDKNKGSASVLLELYRGRELEPDQASAIVYMVASAVQNLSASNVTLIDQQGRLLSAAGSPMADAQMNSQLKHSERIEQTYKRRIEDMLAPMLGAGRVRAEVTATLDFTDTEETRETYDEAQPAVRSEQINETERRTTDSAAQGVPGALSNQPPESAAQAAGDESKLMNSIKTSMRNFELDRTISRVRPQQGVLQKLSVAVLIDNTPIDNAADSAAASGDEEGGTAVAPSTLAEYDIARYTALVKGAIGFDEARGDTVTVMAEAFLLPAEGVVAEEPGFLDNPALQNTLRQVFGVALVLALAFGLVRPMLRGLIASQPPGGASAASGGLLTGSSSGSVQVPGGQLAIAGPSYEEKVTAAKNITGNDPARVAQIVSKWVTADE